MNKDWDKITEMADDLYSIIPENDVTYHDCIKVCIEMVELGWVKEHPENV